MHRSLFRSLSKIQQKALSVVSRAVIHRIDDASSCQQLQVSLRAEETKDPVEHFQPYGFTSVLPGEGEGVYVAVGGDRDHGIVLAVHDRTVRFRGVDGQGLSPGDVALYHRSKSYVHLTEENKNAVLILEAPTIRLGAQAEKSVVRNGDRTKAQPQMEQWMKEVTAALLSMAGLLNAAPGPVLSAPGTIAIFPKKPPGDFGKNVEGSSTVKAE